MNADKFSGTSRKPNDEELFLVAWGRETVKNNLVIATDMLRQLITLNASFFAAGIVFLSPELAPTPHRMLAYLFFFLALVAAFFGALPFETKLDIRIPSEIRKHKESALSKKRFWLWTSAFGTTIGFAAAASGVLAY